MFKTIKYPKKILKFPKKVLTKNFLQKLLILFSSLSQTSSNDNKKRRKPNLILIINPVILKEKSCRSIAPINSNSKIFNSRTIEFYSTSEYRARIEGKTREDRCSGETKTPAIISYPFTRNLSPFHTERAFTVKPQQTLFPSDNTIDISKTAPFKELSNICSTFVTCTISQHYAQVRYIFILG